MSSLQFDSGIARDSGLNSDLTLYDQKKKEVACAITKAKQDYESNLVNQINDEPKKFYNYCRHFTRLSSTADTLIHDGKKITEDHHKASILNDFFASVLVREDNTVTPPCHIQIRTLTPESSTLTLPPRL